MALELQIWGRGVGGVEVRGVGVGGLFEESLFSQTAHSRNTKTFTVRRRLFWEVVVERCQRGSRRGNFSTLTTLLFVLRLVFFLTNCECVYECVCVCVQPKLICLTAT